MYLVRRYHQQLDRFICSGSRKSYLLVLVLLVVALGALGALIFKVGAPAMNGCPWDTPILLGGAWRIVCGQAPHRDFYNWHGDLPYYMTALGIKLNRPCVSAIDYGNALLMGALALPFLAVLRRRTSALAAFLYSIFIALLVITPRPLGDPYDYTDHAMMYNRYGEAFIALLGLVLFLPPREGFGKGWADWAEAVLAGLVVVALLGSKLNYFVLGILFLAVALVLRRVGPGWAAVCVCSAAAFLGLALALAQIPFPALAADYRIMSGCHSVSNRLPRLVTGAMKSIWALPLLLLPIWEHFLGNAPGGGHRAWPWRQAGVIVVLYGGALLLFSSNTQMGEMPLLALAAVYGVELILRQGDALAESPAFAATRHAGAFLVLLLFLLPSMITDLKTFRFITDRHLKKDWDTPEALQSTPMNDFRFVRYGTRWLEMRAYMAELTEGIQLLRRHASPEMRLDALMAADPFELALGMRPALGGTMCLSAMSVTERSHPTLARMLGNATHILVMRHSASADEVPMHGIYGAEWDALPLQLVEETENFALFKLPEAGVGQLPKANAPAR
jgi:hypothetical protein